MAKSSAITVAQSSVKRTIRLVRALVRLARSWLMGGRAFYRPREGLTSAVSVMCSWWPLGVVATVSSLPPREVEVRRHARWNDLGRTELVASRSLPRRRQRADAVHLGDL